MRGRVLDPTRAPIAGARITAVEDGGAPAISAVSDRNGEFSLTADPGSYTVKAAAEGFLEASQAVHLPAGGASEAREFLLQVAGTHESITVTESAGYQTAAIASATKTLTPLRDVPQSITVITQELMQDQMMMSIGDVVRYVPGVTAVQGENNRDQVVIRGNSTSADFFVNGVRDDVQYYRDLYNLERVEALKGPNAMIFGRGGAGGVVNRVTKEAAATPLREITLQGGSYGNKRLHGGLRPAAQRQAGRSPERHVRKLRQLPEVRESGALRHQPVAHHHARKATKITLSYEHFRDHRVADRGIPSVDAGISTYFGNPRESHVRAHVNLGSAMVEHQAGGVTVRNRTMVGDYDRGYQNFVPGAVTADRTGVALSAYNNATSRRNVFNQTDVTFRVETGGIRHTLLAGDRNRPPAHGQLPQYGLLQQLRHLHSRAIRGPRDRDAGDVPPERDRCGQPHPDQRSRGLRSGSGGSLTVCSGGRRPSLRPLRPAVSQQPERR